MTHGADGVRTFEAENVANRFFIIGNGCVIPERDHLIKLTHIGDLSHLTRFLHGPIPRELPLRFRPGLLRRHPPRDGRWPRHATRKLRGYAEPHLATPHVRKGGGASRAAFARHPGLTPANLMYRQAKVAIESAEGVETEIEVGVEGEHRRE
jgi:hypothetical protein